MSHIDSDIKTPVIDARLASRLVAKQFPRWRDLPVEPVVPGGRNNRTFRFGNELMIRLPHGAGSADQVDKEQRWLPSMRTAVPVSIPEPVAMGQPGCDYPWRWSVYRWIEGETADVGPVDSVESLAIELASFLAALRRFDPNGGPLPGAHNFRRGGRLDFYSDQTRQAIKRLDGVIDPECATNLWDRAISSAWTADPVWVHGDVSPFNLLVRDGKLAAVIDFGLCTIGDPACDLVIAWTFFDGTAREAFRKHVGLDELTWDRARGWAFWKAAITASGMVEDRVGPEAALEVIAAILNEQNR
ncbi:MAG: aminoglycoside phosphotransferase family protein [Phycisphaerales bacterium]